MFGFWLDTCLHLAVSDVKILFQKDSVTQKFANSLDHNVQLKLAAAHVNDAMKGRGKFGEARAFFKSEYVKR